jgi:hypothetical protein
MSPRRPDATLVKSTSKFHELFFNLMPRKTNSNFLHHMTLDLDNTFAFLDEVNEDREEKITLFEVILTGLQRSVIAKPKVNRFIKGRRLWQRNELSINFVVKREKTEAGDEVNALIRFSPYDTLETVSKRLKENIYNARKGENPNAKDVKLFGSMPRLVLRIIAKFLRFLDNINMPLYAVIKELPFYCTAFVANLGSLGMDGGYHHLFELGTTELFVVISKVRYDQVVDQKTKQVKVARVMDLDFNIDERVVDGIYWGRVLEII